MFAAAPEAHAQPLATIRVSYQPATYWSLPFYVASQKGFWEAEGLRPEFSTYPSGAPQMEAGATDRWDVGGMGSVAALFGAARYGLLTVALTNDESATNAVMVRGTAAATWYRRPRDLRGRTVLATELSTGEYVLLAYLKSVGLDRGDVRVIEMPQPSIVSAFNGSAGDVFVLWAPSTYLALARGGKVLANGRALSITVPGVLVATPRFARENPDLVVRFLRVYFRALAWQRQNRDQAIDMLSRFNEEGGVSLHRGWLAEEFKTRQVWGPVTQLRLMARPERAASDVDRWFSKIGEHFTWAGILQAMPDPRKFITDEFLRRAAANRDPQPAAFEGPGAAGR
jgi:NitT/TauT family transport system substrate-binding protein